MLKKRIFIKKKIFNFKFSFIIVLSLFFLIYFFMINFKQDYFEILPFDNLIYSIPLDIGGKKVLNLDKKSLNFKENENFNDYINNPILEYSIQVFASSQYNSVKKRFDYIIHNNTNIDNLLTLKKNDFYIVIFNNNLSNEYLLLYKNFKNRDVALNYCSNYVDFLNKCIVVNVKNLN